MRYWGMSGFWTEKQLENLSFFKENREAFAANPLYKGKYVIIHERRLQGIFDTFEAALTAAVSKFPQGEFIVRQLVSDNETVSFLFPAIAFA